MNPATDALRQIGEAFGSLLDADKSLDMEKFQWMADKYMIPQFCLVAPNGEVLDRVEWLAKQREEMAGTRSVEIDDIRVVRLEVFGLFAICHSLAMSQGVAITSSGDKPYAWTANVISTWTFQSDSHWRAVSFFMYDEDIKKNGKL